MNCAGRTPDNKARLRLKGFHKRTIPIKILRAHLDCDVKPLPINEGSGSGGNGEVTGSFTYTLEEIKYVDPIYSNLYRKRINQIFNKSQLIGKVVPVYGKQYRIISKG